jgi:hypothetical protein
MPKAAHLCALGPRGASVRILGPAEPVVAKWQRRTNQHEVNHRSNRWYPVATRKCMPHDAP